MQATSQAGAVLGGAPANVLSGISVSIAGDINGDGLDDVAIGAPYAAGKAGESYILFGSTSGFGQEVSLTSLTGSTGFILSGAAADALSGTVSGAGDVNGDGIDDLVVGAFSANSAAGESYVIFGGAERLDLLDAADQASDGTISLAQAASVLPATFGTAKADLFGLTTSDGNPIFLLAGDDTLTASSGNYSIKGGNGGDFVTTSSGQDTINGGGGEDRLTAGEGNDAVFGGADTDFLEGGDGQDRINGNGHTDFILGDAGNDRINGANGADFITGSSGNDKLIGGGGGDIFNFDFGDGADQITDFEINADKINFSGTELEFNSLNIFQIGSDTVILYGNSDTIQLSDIIATTLDESDFIF